MNRLTVYTCVFGDYQGLLEPEHHWSDCDFVCFTDREDLASDIWSVRHLDLSHLGHVAASRMPKILPHRFLSDCDASLYIDANIRINKNPAEHFLPLLEDAHFWAPKHFARDCIFDEAIECVVLGRASASGVIPEMNRYRSLGIPAHAGMTENNILLRAHNHEHVVKTMEAWWSLYEQGCGRDQLSLPVALIQSDGAVSHLEAGSRAGGSNAILIHQHHERDMSTSLLDRIMQKLLISWRRLKYRTVVF